MPYASKAQQGYFHANKAKLEKQGVNVAEWDRASKGKSLPAKIGKRPSIKRKLHKAFPKD